VQRREKVRQMLNSMQLVKQATDGAQLSQAALSQGKSSAYT